MRNSRQPSEKFLSRIEAYRKPAPVVEPEETPPSRIRKFHEGDGWLWAEICVAVAGFIGLIFLVPTGYALWVDLEDRGLQREALKIDLEDRKLQREALTIDLEDRQTQRAAQAWELVTRPAPGNSGKIASLEYLLEHNESLTGIDLSDGLHGGSVWLKGIEMQDADLIDANLTNAVLVDSKISRSRITGASFQGAQLSGAHISNIFAQSVNFSSSVAGGDPISLTNILFDRSCFAGIQWHSLNADDVAILNSDMRNTTIAVNGVSKELYLYGNDLSGAQVIRGSGVNLALSKGREEEEVQHIYARLTGSSLIGISQSFYLVGSEPKGIDLSQLRGLSLDEYFEERKRIEKSSEQWINCRGTMYMQQRK